MRIVYEVSPEDHAEACRLLEALAEGHVRAMVEEIDKFPEGQFPCCIKCGGFCTRNAPLLPAQAQAIEFTLEHGHPRESDRAALDEVLVAHGFGLDERPTELETEALELAHLGLSRNPIPFEECQPAAQGGMPPPMPLTTVQIRSATQILASKGGHTLELACYQAAQKRRHTDPAAAVVVLCTIPGTFRAVVMCSALHEKPERRGGIDDPVVDARPIGSCGCDLPHQEDDDGGQE